jgi:hypothetical protein
VAIRRVIFCGHSSCGHFALWPSDTHPLYHRALRSPDVEFNSLHAVMFADTIQ